MNRHNLIKVILILSVFSLSGCGQGGGSSSDQEAATINEEQATTEEQVLNEEQAPSEEQVLNEEQASTEEIKSGTAALSVPAGFNFATNYTVTVDVDISSRTVDRAYLSLCDEYTEQNDNSFVVNYDNCSVRTALDSGVYEGSLLLANNTTRILSVIWYYTGEAPEMIEHIALSRSNADIVIR